MALNTFLAMAEKKKFQNILIETPATEESFLKSAPTIIRTSLTN